MSKVNHHNNNNNSSISQQQQQQYHQTSSEQMMMNDDDESSSSSFVNDPPSTPPSSHTMPNQQQQQQQFSPLSQHIPSGSVRAGVQVFPKREHLGPDGKRLCSFGGAICTQRPMKNYDFCVKHILQDPTAPFKQCDYVVSKNSNKLCANPVKITLNQDTRYCNAHKQMLGLIPKGSGQYSKKRKQQMALEKKAAATSTSTTSTTATSHVSGGGGASGSSGSSSGHVSKKRKTSKSSSSGDRSGDGHTGKGKSSSLSSSSSSSLASSSYSGAHVTDDESMMGGELDDDNHVMMMSRSNQTSDTETDDEQQQNELEADQDGDLVMPVVPQQPVVKRGKKRRLLNRKQMMTFHEEYFHSIEGDIETDSDVPTDEDNFEISSPSISSSSSSGGSGVSSTNGTVPLTLSRFSSMKQNPFFARQLMQMAAQQQASGVPNNAISQMLSPDYIETHLITKEEYLKMRRDQITKLLLIYQRQHLKLKKSLKSKYKKFILQKEQVLNSLAASNGGAGAGASHRKNDRISVRLKMTEPTTTTTTRYMASQLPLFEFPDENAQIYTCEKVEKVNSDGIKLCSFGQCNNRRVMCSEFCSMHILYDHNQRLYKAGPGGVTDPVLCAAPSSALSSSSTATTGAGLPRKELDRKTIAVITREEPIKPFDITNPNEEQTRLTEMIKQYQDLKRSSSSSSSAPPEAPMQPPQQQPQSSSVN